MYLKSTPRKKSSPEDRTINSKYRKTPSVQYSMSPSTPSFVQFQGLPEPEINTLLDKVATKHLTLNAGGREAIRIKKMELIRSTFTYLVSAPTWEVASRSCPTQTTPENLEQFWPVFKDVKGRKLDSNVPVQFVKYCNDAQQNKQPEDVYKIKFQITKGGKVLQSSEEINEIIQDAKLEMLEKLKMLQSSEDEPGPSGSDNVSGCNNNVSCNNDSCTSDTTKTTHSDMDTEEPISSDNEISGINDAYM